MRYIIGIDEVGRGPLAGPVTVCAVLCEEKMYRKLSKDNLPAQAGKLPPLGKDSKKLSPGAREKYSKFLKSLMARGTLAISIVHISNKIIDTKGLSFAIKSAILKCLKNLETPTFQSGSRPKVSALKILLDGGLKVPTESAKQFQVNQLSQSTIIKGDEKEKIIAWASILAKVSRDSLMRKYHKKYPQYGFDAHKGYGTLSHRQAIKKHGFSPLHRKYFCKNL